MGLATLEGASHLVANFLRRIELGLAKSKRDATWVLGCKGVDAANA